MKTIHFVGDCEAAIDLDAACGEHAHNGRLKHSNEWKNVTCQACLATDWGKLNRTRKPSKKGDSNAD